MHPKNVAWRQCPGRIAGIGGFGHVFVKSPGGMKIDMKNGSMIFSKLRISFLSGGSFALKKAACINFAG